MCREGARRDRFVYKREERRMRSRTSRHRTRWALFAGLASAALVTGIYSSGVLAAGGQTGLNKFEIDGNLAATTSDGTTEDWVDSANTGADNASTALKCTVGSCAPANVTDGSGQGTGELFRDDLK